MESHILKDQIADHIAGYHVQAVLVYSFNFDPQFFENYVMPIFIDQAEFTDVAIYNKILWRRYLKEERIPDITVYCDFYAKDSSQAPALGYEVNCIQVPAQVGKICNFHSKNLFLLLSKKGEPAIFKNQKLIVLTGSGNITPSGWCDNFEVFAIDEIIPDKSRPNPKTKNQLQTMISSMNRYSLKQDLSEAERKIDHFLKYVDTPFPGDNKDLRRIFYYSSNNSFSNFLQNNIHSEDIKKIEIISPYFSPNTNLLQILQKQYHDADIHILVPRLRSDEVSISESSFREMQQMNVSWCNWFDYDKAKAVRSQHAKIYRFHGQQKVYTVVGSVNFTVPAWEALEIGHTGIIDPKKNIGNVESAIMYIENPANTNTLLRPLKESELNNLKFQPVQDIEANDGNAGDRNAPNITFLLNWKEGVLLYEIKDKCRGRKIVFEDILDQKELINAKQKHLLNRIDLQLLSTNSMIRIKVSQNGGCQSYAYYPIQLHIENKPLDLKMSALQILDFWNFLGDRDKQLIMSDQFSQLVTDNSGIINEAKSTYTSVLNHIATYFNALIKLEEYLFNQLKDRQLFIQEINYYLLSENIDTIMHCLSALERQVKEGEFKTLYWMFMQIAAHNLYGQAEEHPLLKQDRYEEMRANIKREKKAIIKKSKALAAEIPGLEEEQKLRWFEGQIKDKK